MTEGCTDNGAFLQAMLEEEQRLFDEIRAEGAAVAFGLMGMAWAIRAREAYNPDCMRCVALDLEHDPECGWT